MILSLQSAPCQPPASLSHQRVPNLQPPHMSYFSRNITHPFWTHRLCMHVSKTFLYLETPFFIFQNLYPKSIDKRQNGVVVESSDSGAILPGFFFLHLHPLLAV